MKNEPKVYKGKLRTEKENKENFCGRLNYVELS